MPTKPRRLGEEPSRHCPQQKRVSVVVNTQVHACYPQHPHSLITGHFYSPLDNPGMQRRTPMPRFDFFKDHPVVKLIALALIVTPPTLWGLAALLKVLR
jgi:hypothetical protein